MQKVGTILTDRINSRMDHTTKCNVLNFITKSNKHLKTNRFLRTHNFLLMKRPQLQTTVQIWRKSIHIFTEKETQI